MTISTTQLFGAFATPPHTPNNTHQLWNLVGAIPLVGIGVACIRGYCVLKSTDRNYSTGAKVVMVFRGFLELLGLGVILVLLVDVPVDLYRWW